MVVKSAAAAARGGASENPQGVVSTRIDRVLTDNAYYSPLIEKKQQAEHPEKMRYFKISHSIFNFRLFLKEYDFSFYNNIDKIVSKMTEKNLDYIISKPKSSFPMETLSTSKLEGLFLGFLEEIKAPKEWKEIYTTLKAENRIIYEEEEGNINNSQVFVDEDGIRKIKVSNDGTINTFINLLFH